ncbi:hypothetical protein KR018_011854 [Drosophila ironensis]|nr:hypothetical protein KR018_011854 [Drosophila ironensis]
MSVKESSAEPAKDAVKVSVKEEDPTKPQMSFADWKKCKEALKQEPKAAQKRTGNPDNHAHAHSHAAARRPQNPHRSGNYLPQERNNFPPLTRPPAMPMPLYGGFGNNYGSGPGPVPGMGPNMMRGRFGGNSMGPLRRNANRPLDPPPFWDDLMSPAPVQPPMQPPMPKCPTLWNLLPKQQQQHHHHHPNGRDSKKYKPREHRSSPPPPPQPLKQEEPHTQSQAPKKAKRNGPFVQINGQWIQKPEAPLPLDEAPPGTKEERQRQWKEYRQAMKPFKNREFHNQKRTVQRLGKIPRDQLDELQLERLQKAEEYIGAHKAMLTIKHAERWVQQEDGKRPTDGGKGQVFVRRPGFKPEGGGGGGHKMGPNTSKGFDPKQPFFSSGRAIMGGADSGASPPTQQQLKVPPPTAPTPTPTPQTTTTNSQSQWSSGGATSGSNSNPSFYSHYSNNFVRGGGGDSLLPP